MNNRMLDQAKGLQENRTEFVILYYDSSRGKRDKDECDTYRNTDF